MDGGVMTSSPGYGASIALRLALISVISFMEHTISHQTLVFTTSLVLKRPLLRPLQVTVAVVLLVFSLATSATRVPLSKLMLRDGLLSTTPVLYRTIGKLILTSH